MAYVRHKKIAGTSYYSLVEGTQKDGKRTIQTLKSYGTTLPKLWQPKVYLADCMDVMKTIPSNCIDLILTDPPYFLAAQKKVGGWDNFADFTDFEKFTEKWLSECARILKEGGTFFTFFCKYKLTIVYKAMMKHGLKPMNIFAWHKNNMISYNPNKCFAEQVELAICFTKLGSYTTFNNGKTLIPNLYKAGSVGGNKRKQDGFHPTEKPEKLIKHLIELLSNEEDIVFDPFNGKGTVAACAYELLRKALAVELDPYFQAATKQRLESLRTKMGIPPTEWVIDHMLDMPKQNIN